MKLAPLSDHFIRSGRQWRVLLSMTGFGEARHQSDAITLGIEVRAVNNRYLKVTVRGSEPYPMLEPELEKTVRKFVKRGTILIHVRAERHLRETDFQLNSIALKSYLRQVQTVCDSIGWGQHAHLLIGQALALPGVAAEPGFIGRPKDEEWHIAENVLETALGKLHQMRQEEGRAMADELLVHRQNICSHLDRIREHLPVVTEQYRNRLRDRVAQALKESGVQVNNDDLIREVAVFSERGDIAEEVTRLASHLEQFRDIVREEKDAPGRKLEFLTQEMSREANTIGSKAGDVAVSRQALEIKTSLEKIRELVQNVE